MVSIVSKYVQSASRSLSARKGGLTLPKFPSRRWSSSFKKRCKGVTSQVANTFLFRCAYQFKLSCRRCMRDMQSPTRLLRNCQRPTYRDLGAEGRTSLIVVLRVKRAKVFERLFILRMDNDRPVQWERREMPVE